MTIHAQRAASPGYTVFESLELVTFTRTGIPLYLGASEQLWLPEDWDPEDPSSCEAPTLEALRAITAVDGRPVPWLWRPGGYLPCRTADVLVLLGGSEPGRTPRGFRCACGRLDPILYRLPEGGYVCEPCREAGRHPDSTTSGGPLVLEDDGRRLLVASSQPVTRRTSCPLS